MYLTPPRSHSYGLHADVMDAFMVQLVGERIGRSAPPSASTSSCGAATCSTLPMGTKHHAWTEGSLSAHLTVNVERQFVVWGALLMATACRLLLDARKCGSALQPFGMEGETGLSRALQSLAEQNGAPRLLRTPDALACGAAARPPPTRRRCTTSGPRSSTRRAPPHGWRTTTAPSTSRAHEARGGLRR